jgi:hypothetical protein
MSVARAWIDGTCMSWWDNRKKGDQVLIELRSIMKTINVDDIHHRTYDSQVRIVQGIDKVVWNILAQSLLSEWFTWYWLQNMLIYIDAIKE